MEIPPEVCYVVREGRSIAYQRFGSGERRVVSFGNIGNLDLLWSDPSFYDGALELFERSEVLIFDQLGFGLSDPVDHVPTFEERAADLGAVMDAAGFERATICGIYDSCHTSMVFAAQHPERVEGLVLLSPFAQGWRSAPFEELVGWDSPAQVEAYDRTWQGITANWGGGNRCGSSFRSWRPPRTCACGGCSSGRGRVPRCSTRFMRSLPALMFATFWHRCRRPRWRCGGRATCCRRASFAM